MRKRVLGSTGLRVSVIGMGGIPLSAVREKEAIKIVRKAIELGINLFDTSVCYGRSEERIGKAIRGHRSECYLVTKSMRRTKAGILKDIDASLRNLGTDAIDIYQLHGVTERELSEIFKEDGALEGLHEARRRGKVVHIGVTGHDCKVLEKLMVTREFSSIEVPFNFVETGPLERLIPLASRLNIGVIAMKPLGGGIFKNVELSLKYVLRYPISAAIPGMSSVKEVEQDVKFGQDRTPLSVEETKCLQEEARELGSRFCRRCGYCSPCPRGVPIQDILLAPVYLRREGLAYMVEGRQFDETIASAEKCDKCNLCVSKCPYNLPIPDLIETYRDLYAPLMRDYCKTHPVGLSRFAKRTIKRILKGR